ncbi:glycoside hydrolase family 73 protein [Paenibacillus sp. OV219]|uniref:glycoside hydrolase family 73 protein n=1 Tax=Paenibacillus sp. OV219 TaxID=1884377 RepID=UPI0008B11391|nr:glucosaminidase domain-containing protein [Paenibacillus sp. OV219]SEN28136.1 flagellar protein FlgJ [Paenibacillus sp. OV219]
MDSFFAKLVPIARQLYLEGSPIYPSVRLAQCWLETGGNIPYWNNLAGYKGGSGVPNGYWKGAVVNKQTWEVINGRRVDVVATFRAYDSIYDFFKDQDLLFARSRYTRVHEAKGPFEQAQMLLECGYATDPDYAKQIIAIINESGLTQYDSKNGGDEPMTAEEKKAFQDLMDQVKQLSTALNVQTAAVASLQVQAAQMLKHDQMDTVPAWAKDAVDAAVKAKLIDTTVGGSYDFYRLLTVLHRKKLI